MDELLLNVVRPFLAENAITISLVLLALKQIAAITPWAGDDKILSIITGLFDKIRVSKK